MLLLDAACRQERVKRGTSIPNSRALGKHPVRGAGFVSSNAALPSTYLAVSSFPPFLNSGFEWSLTWPGFGPEEVSPAGGFAGGIGGGGGGVEAVDGASCAGFAGGGEAVVAAGVSVLLQPASRTKQTPLATT